jgi:hypothetical protein
MCAGDRATAHLQAAALSRVLQSVALHWKTVGNAPTHPAETGSKTGADSLHHSDRSSSSSSSSRDTHMHKQAHEDASADNRVFCFSRHRPATDSDSGPKSSAAWLLSGCCSSCCASLQFKASTLLLCSNTRTAPDLSLPLALLCTPALLPPAPGAMWTPYRQVCGGHVAHTRAQGRAQQQLSRCCAELALAACAAAAAAAPCQ